MSDELITSTEAAELSGYTPAYLRRLLRTGKLKGLRFGPIWQVNRFDLETFCNSRPSKWDGRYGSRAARKATAQRETARMEAWLTNPLNALKVAAGRAQTGLSAAITAEPAPAAAKVADASCRTTPGPDSQGGATASQDHPKA